MVSKASLRERWYGWRNQGFNDPAYVKETVVRCRQFVALEPCQRGRSCCVLDIADVAVIRATCQRAADLEEHLVVNWGRCLGRTRKD